MNALCHKGVLAEDKLFATLGTSVGRLTISPDDIHYQTYLVNDTIGFISDLPPSLIQAFASTLEDSIQSQILLHVVDASDTYKDHKIKVVQDILSDIGAQQTVIYVFNKIDRLTSDQLDTMRLAYKHYDPIYCCTFDKSGLDDLKKRICCIDFA